MVEDSTIHITLHRLDKNNTIVYNKRSYNVIYKMRKNIIMEKMWIDSARARALISTSYFILINNITVQNNRVINKSNENTSSLILFRIDLKITRKQFLHPDLRESQFLQYLIASDEKQ